MRIQRRCGKQGSDRDFLIVLSLFKMHGTKTETEKTPSSAKNALCAASNEGAMRRIGIAITIIA